MIAPMLEVRQCDDKYQENSTEQNCSVEFSMQVNPPSIPIPGKLSGIVLMDSQWLSPSVVDALAEAQQDWISFLQHTWEIELYSLSLLGIGNEANSLKHCRITVQEIISLTLQASYHCLIVLQDMYWCYTCCLEVVGLGRVRLVVCFNNSQRTGNPAVFLTNRLAWSPQTVLTYWRHCSSINFDHKQRLR
jgi:hypothetical protein